MSQSAPAALRNARVLVTGATGFVGRWVVESLLERDAEVGVVARDPGRLQRAHAERVACVFTADLAKPGSLAAVLARWQPAALFQLAGYGVAKHERDPAAMQRLNADLLAEAVDGLCGEPMPQWRGLRLVHVGSALEYGVRPEPLDEAVLPQPTTPYGRSKLAGTETLLAAARKRRLPAIVARLFTVFGPGERDGRLLPTLLSARDHEQPVLLSSGEQTRDFALVEDVARSLVDLALLPGAAVVASQPPFDTGVINIASGKLHRVREFALAAAHALGIAPSRLLFGAMPMLAEEMPHLPVPVARMQRALGRTLPADLPVLLERVREWLDRGDHG